MAPRVVGVAMLLALLVAAVAWFPAPAAATDLAAGHHVCSAPTDDEHAAAGECSVEDEVDVDEEALGGYAGFGYPGFDDEAALLRALAQGNGSNVISYGALKQNQPVCVNRPGRPRCGSEQQRVNPYRRGCSAAIRCARTTD